MHDRAWVHDAIAKLDADVTRSADTHLIPLDLPSMPGIRLYLKDESTHPTGSLKHRLARSLFLFGLCNGWIEEDTTVVEASSGSTAVSEAYFARLLGLDFIAVMPRTTQPEKIAMIEFQGGSCHLVDDPSSIDDVSRTIAEETGGHFMNQFAMAAQATDWRGNNNIAESIFQQMAREPHAVPSWIVCSAGTGGTSATVGRYARYRQAATRVCVVDPDHSVFFDSYRTGDRTLRSTRSSDIEGIGRPRVERSFVPQVIDRMIRVPDAASLAAIHFLDEVLGRRCGGSTGTNLWGAIAVAEEMHRTGAEGSVVTLLCDGGERYRDTYYNLDWLAAHGHDIGPWMEALRQTFFTGRWEPPTRLETVSREEAGTAPGS